MEETDNRKNVYKQKHDHKEFYENRIYNIVNDNDKNRNDNWTIIIIASWHNCLEFWHQS